MAIPKDLKEFAGERLYRNSLDEILDQIQREQAQQELVLQRRNNVISNDPDPVKKLNEIQSIEKKVENEPPEVKDAVLNQTYQKPSFEFKPQQTPQYTMGAPRGQLRNLDNEQIEFYSELAKIQKPFDEVYQEKLKTAQAIPGRNVMDPMSGGSYPIPGSSKEEIARQQTIKELENRGVLNPSLSRDIGNFLTSAIPLGGMTPREQAESTFYPVRTALAQLPGTLVGLGATGSLIKAPKIAQKGADLFTRGNRLGNLLQGTGISTVKAQKFGAGALASGSTFGAYSLVNQIDENTSIADKTKTIVENAILGTAFGVTSNLNNPLVRALTEGAVGVVEAKLVQGASNQEALLNGLIFVGFGALNKRDVSRVEKGLAIKEFGKVSDDAVQIMQEMRANAGLKPYTKKQVSDWKDSINKYADRFKYEKYDANRIKADTEEFISRFLNSNDPKGTTALIKKIGDQTRTQGLQAKAKTKKESVTVPETGKVDVPTKENVLKLSTGQQLDRMKDLGYTEDQFVRLSNTERMEILDNSIKAQNYLDKQPTRPSMPGPETAPDDTPSVTKPDKLVPKKLEPKKEEVKQEKKVEVKPEKKAEVKPEQKVEKKEPGVAQTEQQAEYNIVDTQRRGKKSKTSLDAKGLTTIQTSPKFVKIDESKFQPREEYNQAVIDDIAENFNPAKWEEPVVWEDPKTGDYIVVSGHHRHLGVKKGGFTGATYKVLPKGTTLDEAINISEEGNLARTVQTDFENANVVRRRIDKKQSVTQIVKDLPGLTSAKTTAGKTRALKNLVNLTYLDKKGKLKENYDNINEFPRIRRTSFYIGSLRKQYNWMPDKYEDDIFTYLYTENGIRQDDADWKLNLENTLDKLIDVKDRPGSILKQLRKEPLKPKEGTSDEVLDEINKQKNYIETLSRQINDPKELEKRVQKKQELIYNKKYKNPVVIAKKYDNKWKAGSTWHNNLWRLTLEERGNTKIGEDALIGKTSLSDLDKKHADAIIKAHKRGELIRPEVIKSLGSFRAIKDINLKPDNKAIYKNDTLIYQEVIAELKKEKKEARQSLNKMIEDANKDDPDQEGLFAPIDQFNMFGGSDMLPDIKKSDKAKLQNLVAELTQVNKEQRLLDNQISQGILTKLKARSQFKELEKRQNDLVKAIHKIEKPINGSKYTPGLLFDYNKQFELNLAGKKQTDLFRKNATETQKENAKELKTLVSRGGKRRGLPSVRASAIQTQIEKFGASHFIGKRVKNQKELADLVQIARDPRFETLRYYFVDDKGKIVGYTAVSNKMPGWVNPYTVPGAKRDYPILSQQGVDGPTQLTWWIQSLMNQHKATGFYMQHNHPSADATPSTGDINVTKHIAETFQEKFLGHVVIDFNEYSTISIKNKYRKIYKANKLVKRVKNKITGEFLPPTDFLEVKTIKIPGLSEREKTYKDHKNAKGKVVSQIKKVGVATFREGFVYLSKSPKGTYSYVKFNRKGKGKILIPLDRKKFKSEESALKSIENYIVPKGVDPLRKLNAPVSGSTETETDPLFYNNLKLYNIDRLIPYAKKIIKENHVTLVPLTMDMRVNGIIDIPLKTFLDAQKNKIAMLRLKAQVRKIAQNFGGQRMWAVANISPKADTPGGDRVDMFSRLDATLKTLKKDSFINDAVRTHSVGKNKHLITQLYPDRTEDLKGHLEFRTKPGKVTTQPSKIVGEVDTSYRISWHTAPRPEKGYKNSGDNVEDIYPDDVYGPMGAQYYGTRGHRDPMDNKTLSIMRELRGKPNKEVTVYRAVPKKIKDINPGDWVTINRDYAVEHGKGPLGDKYEIISKTVKAKEIFTAGDSIHEWGYQPSVKETKPVIDSNNFKKWFGDSKVVDEQGKPLVVYHGTGQTFDEFNTEINRPELSFTSNPTVANEYAVSGLNATNPQMYPVYLSLKNPAVYDAKGLNWADFKVWTGYKWANIHQLAEMHKVGKEFNDDRNPGQKITFEKTDGIILKNINEVGNNLETEFLGTTYQVFEPTQIKSAIGNRGTFDSEDPSIIADQIPAFKLRPYAKTRKEGKAQRKVDPKIYERVTVKKPFKLFKERKEQIKSPGLISKAMAPLSTRLRVINPVLKRSIRRFQANVDLNTSKDLKVAEGFMKATDQMRKKNKKDYAVLDLAMKNSDVEMVEKIINKHNMNKDYQDIKVLLDDLYTRAEMVGYEPNYISNYFPRRIEDSDGLLKYLETSDSWGIVQGAIKEKEKEIGRRLEKDERVKLINSLIRGFGGRIVVQKPANLKEREIEYLTPEINEFYYDSNTALHTYINRMNEAIEIKRFFGKGMGPTDPTIQIDNNVIGEYVDDLVEKGLVKTNQQDELINLLRVRFATGPMDHRVARARNLAYLSTMGQLTSAITQIGDFAWSIYSGGLTGTGKALGRSIARKSKITRKDIGVEKIAEEFTDVRKTAKVLDTVFTLTGLKYIDSLGKESLVNSTIEKYRKEAIKGKFSSSRKDRIEEAFSKEELPKVINDLKSGEVTDDIKYLAHYTLSDFQPVSLTEMPEFYLKAPNGRIMYMLKTYTLKQFDILRNEAFKKMNEGKKAEGFKRLMYLTGILMLTGMSSDKIKGFVTGRESTYDELVGDNILRLFGLHKYLIWYQRRYKNFGATLLKAVVPPISIFNPVFESFVRDLDDYYKKNKKDEEWKIQDLDSPKNIPIFGKLYYNYFGRGAQFNKERKEKSKKKKSKKLKRPGFANY